MLSHEKLLSARIFKIWKAQNLAIAFKLSSVWYNCPAVEHIFDAISLVTETTAEQILPPVMWIWQHESCKSEYCAFHAWLDAGCVIPVSISLVATSSSLVGTYKIGFISTRALENVGENPSYEVNNITLLHVSNMLVQTTSLSCQYFEVTRCIPFWKIWRKYI